MQPRITIPSSIWFSLTAWLLLEGVLLYAMLQQPFVGFDWETRVEDPHALWVSKLYPGSRNLRVGDKVTALAPISEGVPGEWVKINSALLVRDVDSVSTFSQFDSVIEYNARLYDVIGSSRYLLKVNGKVVSMHGSARPLSSLPIGYWSSALTTLVAFIAGTAIWSIRRRTIATRYLLLSGALYSFGSLFTIFYFYRHLAMSPPLLLGSIYVEHLLMGGFPYALLALLLSYPRRTVSNFSLGVLMLVPVLFVVNELLRLYEPPFHAFSLNSVIALLLAFPAAMRQWLAVRGNPLEVAGLKWFLLSIFTAPLIGVLLYLLPPFFDHPPQLPLWVVHLVFLSVYLGFSLGVIRYRLFDIERWWFKSWLWFVSGALLVVLDFVLVYFFHLDHGHSIMLSLVVMAWLYFPLRQWLWSSMFSKGDAKALDYLLVLVDAVFVERGTTGETWKKVLETVFRPLGLYTMEGERCVPVLKDNGLYMEVPDVDPGRSVRLMGRSEGTRLFSPDDRDLARVLKEIFTMICERKRSHQEGARVERARIMRDLHDDVGANLITLAYRLDDGELSDLARDTLKLLRETIYTLDDSSEIDVHAALDEWREETSERARSLDFELNWRQSDSIPEKRLMPRQHVNLGRILREATSNALKYGKGSSISVVVDYLDGGMTITMENEATLADVSCWKERNGINNIRTRVAEIGGSAEWCQSREHPRSVSLCINMPL